jgi:very-short-patch-repair endonuclease
MGGLCAIERAIHALAARQHGLVSRRAFDGDRARDRALVSEGWRVVRFTDRQITTDPAGVARELRQLLLAS